MSARSRQAKDEKKALQGGAIFISHSSDDDWLVDRIGEKMHTCGDVDTFIDHKCLEFGSAFEVDILSYIRRCTELCVLITPWAATKSWIWKEIGMAIALDKRIVPILYGVKIEDADNYASALNSFRQYQTLTLKDIDYYFKQLKRKHPAKGPRTQPKNSNRPQAERQR